MIVKKTTFLDIQIYKRLFILSLHGEEENINQSFSWVYLYFSTLKRSCRSFCEKKAWQENISFVYRINIPKHFLHVKNRKSLKKTDEWRKTYKIECDFSPIRSCVSNRLDNKSSSKCLDGSIKNTFSIYEVHGVENLFATRKFILFYWISIVNSNAKMWMNTKESNLMWKGA